MFKNVLIKADLVKSKGGRNVQEGSFYGNTKVTRHKFEKNKANVVAGAIFSEKK